jgi:hypothetical protein
VPIACNLTESAAGSQLEEWRTLLAASVDAVDRVSSTELVLRLGDDPAGLMAIIRLAQREKACCAFFEFALRIEADSVALQVSVPEDATSMLDDFAAPLA